jgi:hypothetical protein
MIKKGDRHQRVRSLHYPDSQLRRPDGNLHHLLLWRALLHKLLLKTSPGPDESRLFR